MRRDGLGLVYAILTVVTAVVAWWGFPAVSNPRSRSWSGSRRSLDLLVPLFFGWMTWRTLRHPQRRFAAHSIVGGLLVVFAAAGLIHVIAGAAQPIDGQAAMRAGGGWAGWIAAIPFLSPARPRLTGRYWPGSGRCAHGFGDHHRGSASASGNTGHRSRP